jgi:hypothetical protein
MVSNDAIHVQVGKKGEDNNVEGMNNLEADDYLCAVHDDW